jgi:uncharacterized protein (DUF1800 family)
MAPVATPDNVSHLLRRAAWGATPDEIDRAAADGIAATVDRLLDPTTAPPAGDAYREPTGREAYRPAAFILWWFHLVSTSPASGIERLLWFWHGHFATGLRKVRYPALMRDQFVGLRRYGLGRFDDLLSVVTNDAAMNVWLDLHTSIAGRPNENYARELMELFTMGVGSGYSQTDVAEAGRAFTGYGLVYSPRPRPRPLGTRLRPELHDYGVKTVLGRTGPLSGDDVIHEIVARPECHRFVATRFWLRYAGTEPSEATVDDLASSFSGELLISDLLRTMLTHEAFYGDDVKAGLVTQPVELLVRTVRNFELPVADPSTASLEDVLEGADRRGGAILRWAELMGQVPGLPPNVGGWPHNDAWLTSDRAAGRLLVGAEVGRLIATADTDLSANLRALSRLPEELAATILAQFGLVSWSAETLQTAAAAARGSSGRDAVAAAFAAVFVSPEVTLA